MNLELHVSRPLLRGRGRNLDASQHLVRAQGSFVSIGNKVFHGNFPPSSRAFGNYTRAQCQKQCGWVRVRVGEAEVAAQGAGVSDANVCHTLLHIDKDRQVASNQGGPLNAAVCCCRADPNDPIAQFDLGASL